MDSVAWFTSVPHGIFSPRSLKVAVLVTPRLAGSCGEFEQWTQFVHDNNQFAATIGALASIPVQCKNNLKPQLWGKLFKSISCAPYKTPSPPEVKTYDSKQVQQCVRDSYQTLASAFLPDDLRSPGGSSADQDIIELAKKHTLLETSPGSGHLLFSELLLQPGNHRVIGTDETEFERLRLQGILGADSSVRLNRTTFATLAARSVLSAPLPALAHEPTNPLVGLLAFFGRVQRRADTVDKTRSKPQPLDFHQCVSLLLNDPELMRALGLVLEFEVPIAADQNPGSPLAVSIAPTFKLQNIDVKASRTQAYLSFDNNRFEPFVDSTRSNDYKISDGQIDLTTDYFVECLGLESAGSNVVTWANDVVKRRFLTKERPLEDEDYTPSADVPPVIPTAGICLYHTKRKAVLDKKRSSDPEKPPDLFFAQDLITGFAVDIRSNVIEGGVYNATQYAGQANYCGNNQPCRIWEAPLRTVTTLPTDKAPDQDTALNILETSEMVLTFRGPSLAVKELGSAIQNDGTLESTTHCFSPGVVGKRQLVDGDDETTAWSRLRAGATYQVGLRPVYVTGNCDQYDSTRAILTKPIKLLRSEPVLPPRLIYRERPSDGDKRNHDVMIVRTVVDWPEGADKPSLKHDRRVDVRYILPPSVPDTLAKLHLDKTHVTKLKEGFRRINFRDGDVDDELGPPRERPSEHHPYLPDPLLRHAIVRLTDISGRELGNETVDFYSDTRTWPDCMLSQIEVHASLAGNPSMTADWDVDSKPGLESGDEQSGQANRYSKRLIVTVPPGWTVLVHFSALLSDDDLNQHIVWDLMQNKTGNVRQFLKDGRHPMLTPVRVVRIYHALDQVLIRPSFSFSLPNSAELKSTRYAEDQAHHTWIVRAAGSPTAQLNTTYTFDRNSIAKLQLCATWVEWTDNPKENAPVLRPMEAVVDETIVSKRVPTGENDSSKSVVIAQKFTDTAYRRVRFQARAFSRFSEFFDSGSPGLRTAGSSQSLDVLASERPDPPHLLYLLPSFRWETPEQGKKKTFSHRRIGGVRVFLARPWFSSGDDELLGVIVQKEGSWSSTDMTDYKPIPFAYKSDDDQTMSQIVSRWGADPEWRAPSRVAGPLELDEWQISPPPPPQGLGGDPSVRLQPSHLGACGWDLDLPNVPNLTQQVGVVGYPVHYDIERKLWYADIGLASLPSYGTFIRLVLTRYQPHAITGKELSPVVLADFSLLNADRTVRVCPNDWKSFSVEIRGMKSPGGRNVSTRFVISLQKRTVQPDGWYQVADIPECEIANWDDDLLWRGLIEPQHVCSDCRLVVREYEGVPGQVERPIYLDVLAFN